MTQFSNTATKAHTTSAILQDAHKGKKNIKQFVAKYKWLFIKILAKIMMNVEREYTS